MKDSELPRVCVARTDFAKSYPDSYDGYGPGVALSELAIPVLPSAKPNQVYRLVRQLFIDAKMDHENLETKFWNPLGRWISPGQKVFILCNFVQQRRIGQNQRALWAKCTHGSVLRAICDYVLIAMKGKGEIVFGCAPIWSTCWKQVLRETGADIVESFYRSLGLAVRSIDLRTKVTCNPPDGSNLRNSNKDNDSECIEIDLGVSSLLDSVSQRESNVAVRFRVMDYDPHCTERYQNAQHHIYSVHREILTSDVIISLPKLKTHEKVGVTCSLKGFVGSIGNKGCLAHHRFGGPQNGGDEYPDNSELRRLQSTLHDYANSFGGQGVKRRMSGILDRNMRRVRQHTGAIYGGAWPGNDTCWRMALDVARILFFSDSSGRMTDRIQRKHICLIDGIFAGEGNGPLSPSPANAGVLVFSTDILLADLAACQLMGFDPQKIPLIREAFQVLSGNKQKMPLPINEEIIFNGTSMLLSSLKPVLGRAFRHYRSWGDYLRSKNKAQD